MVGHIKKERAARTRSHVWEWKEDLLVYFTSLVSTEGSVLFVKKREIQEAVTYTQRGAVVHIPKRSLDKAMLELQGEGLISIRYKPGGRGSGLEIKVSEEAIAACKEADLRKKLEESKLKVGSYLVCKTRTGEVIFGTVDKIHKITVSIVSDDEKKYLFGKKWMEQQGFRF